MRLTVVISALVLVVCGALAGYAWVRRPAEVVAPVATGMDVLRAYQCRRSETKVIIVRGVEDNHSPAGVEPSFIRPERMHADVQSYFAVGSYDQVQADRRMTDSFKVPATVARGMFLMRLKPVANNDTDTFGIGDHSKVATDSASQGHFGSPVVALANQPGWTKQNELHFAELAAIRLVRPDNRGLYFPAGTLLDFIRRGANDGWVDFMVQDDTSVDFAGMALCLEPARGKGLSLGPWAGVPLPVKGIAWLTCSYGGRDQQNCDPYVGDMACTARLPVACFHGDEIALPKALSEHRVRAQWSGGRLAFTDPVAGTQFSSAKQVDGLCAARFGSGWRTARLHDGTNNTGIAGFSDAAAPASRVWIDVVGSPYATCWTR